MNNPSAVALFSMGLQQLRAEIPSQNRTFRKFSASYLVKPTYPAMLGLYFLCTIVNLTHAKLSTVWTNLNKQKQVIYKRHICNIETHLKVKKLKDVSLVLENFKKI